jgi:hypothetical protein
VEKCQSDIKNAKIRLFASFLAQFARFLAFLLVGKPIFSVENSVDTVEKRAPLCKTENFHKRAPQPKSPPLPAAKRA